METSFHKRKNLTQEKSEAENDMKFRSDSVLLQPFQTYKFNFISN